jgi:hypothetical protein
VKNRKAMMIKHHPVSNQFELETYQVNAGVWVCHSGDYDIYI